MQNTQWLAMVIIPLSFLRLSLGLILLKCFLFVVLCLRPTPALGIKRGNSARPPELPGHPPEATQVLRGACFPAERKSPCLVSAAETGFLSPSPCCPSVRRSAPGNHRETPVGDGRHTRTQVLTAPLVATPVRLSHSSRLTFLPRSLGHTLSGLGR